MDFALSDSLQELLARASAFMEEHVYPLEPIVGEKGFFGATDELEAARKACKEAGLWAPQMPKEYGGAELPFLDHAHLSEVIGRSMLGHYVFGCPAPDAGNMEILLEHGTDAQKERWLKPLARGEIRSCFSMTEPDKAGSNPTWMDTTAVRDGDEWVIDGKKWFTTAADGAAFAIVMAVTNAEAPVHGRASMIIVPTDAPGFVHARRIPIMGDEGEGWMSHSEIVYEGCRVPVENTLGAEGAGFLIAQQRLGPGRIHHCMRWLGLCERGFDLMCQRAAKREIAPGKPLGTRQMVQQWIAESRAQIDAARLYVQKAAWTIDTKGLYEARTEISCIKFFVANVLQEVLDRAIQVHGALGITEDTPLSHIWRHERGARIYDGPDEVHKHSVARRILKSYGLEVRSQSQGG
ncbi:MAG TPA: acyl-CoA dehydrogenase family protein [Polyangiaceae bacterium LLY-WYZ-15_(1-7)]|nr:acyl-CoA dehydrogenase [Myxococcales bacterium]MAT29446.1 acyl-CoA dehydrogenase [Sandaracinus sp.]HJK89841.1 acyl-CoA dehydrogenase family protein [Polyangiaceae bacterium LLY-WYZ-15_(1-7)]MBJ73403.1 acyl-CoA dehydrogenase [Sandaracinus sp.]HJL01463.1 acyl-CoA dehydrogenase family protein [Polyangiaceae bacterium LLY-WYZ-15_(1-7)]